MTIFDILSHKNGSDNETFCCVIVLVIFTLNIPFTVSRCRHTHHRHGVGAGVPCIRRQQELLFAIRSGLHIKLDWLCAAAVSLRDSLLDKQIMTLRFQIIQRQRFSIGIFEGENTVFIRCSRRNWGSPVSNHIISTRLIQGIFCPRNRLAVLVNFKQFAFRHGLDVVPHSHIGICVAAFQIKEIEGVIRLVGKGITLPFNAVLFSGSFVHLFQRWCSVC